jgi:fibro-slime domain-containing protein
MRAALVSLVVSFFVIGCGGRTELPVCDRLGEIRTCESICGQGIETCVGYRWESCTAPKPAGSIPIAGKIRDILASHPDFEKAIGSDPGIVATQLGPDGKPVYAGKPTTPTTTGKANFDTWYHDSPGINLTTDFTLPLTPTANDPSRYTFATPNFFPIDGQLFGNEGNSHNYHFTLEVQIPFRYVGGETLTFSGDDDLWVFINERLAIDLGGVHSTDTRSISLDELADSLGITPGGVFSFALFFAERHSTESNFSLETTISEFAVCPSK